MAKHDSESICDTVNKRGRDESLTPKDEKGYRRKTKRELEKATETNGVRQETFHDLIFRGELSWTKKSLLNFYFILFFLFIY